ncbi:PTS sugar transporter subunit IIC [Thermoanaerobacteraceae bacterium SP2]|nr:PTS sugar transporter subunit IIC [Thermoanaerobacteraceae bacterium SP2]
MTKLQNIVERWISPLAVKFASNRYIMAIKDGMISSLPIMIVGSFFTIIAKFPYQPYLNWLKTTGFDKLLSIPISTTLNILAIIVAFFTAYSFAKNDGIDAISAGILSVVSFLIITPLNIIVGEKSIEVIPFDYLGAKGLFVAIIVGILTASISSMIIKRGWTIKMPYGVPENIQKSFSALIPAILVTSIFLCVRIGFYYTSFNNLHDFMYKMLQKPLMKIGGTPLAVIIVIILNSLFWFFGIHSLAINSIVLPILTALDLENLAAFQQGLPIPHISTWRFFYITTKIGGTGALLGLCIYMAFYAKSERYKTLGKLALPAAIFNVNEPLVFGIPVMLNPIMLAPFIFVPVICYVIAYVTVVIGIVNPVIGLQLPMETPAIISGFLQGGTSFAILQVVLIIISTLLYIPFFNIMDRQAVEEEGRSSVNNH